MATLQERLAALVNSPKGREAVDKAKALANDPKNRQKIEGMVSKLRNRGQRPGA